MANGGLPGTLAEGAPSSSQQALGYLQRYLRALLLYKGGSCQEVQGLKGDLALGIQSCPCLCLTRRSGRLPSPCLRAFWKTSRQGPACSRRSSRLSCQRSGFPHLASRLLSAGAWLSSLPTPSPGPAHVLQAEGTFENIKVQPALGAGGQQPGSSADCAEPSESQGDASGTSSHITCKCWALTAPQLCRARQGLGPHGAHTGPSADKRIKLCTLTAQI